MKLRSPEKKRTLVRRYNLYGYYRYVNKILQIPDKIPEEWLQNKSDIDLITIAYNNTHVLRHQIEKIKKNVIDKNLTYIIADNSDNLEKKREIKNICESEDILYIEVPKPLKNSYKIGGSKSHSAALNWFFYRIIKERKPKIFGFLDHDIYPLRKVSIASYLENRPIFGKKDMRNDYAYLWPGFCFFQYDYVKDLKLDFSPVKVGDSYLDTGGGLWYQLYSKVNMDDFDLPQTIQYPLIDLGYNYPENVEFIDKNWFHSMNASLWKKASDYTSAIDDILEKELIIE